MERRYEIKLINIIKMNIFKNKIFYCVFFLLKFIGIILCSRNIRGFEKYSNNITISISTILSHLTLFERDFGLIQYNYQTICIFIFILFLIINIMIIFYLLKFKQIYKKNNIFELKTEKYLFNKKVHYLIIKIMCYILLFLLFFSQHIIEFLMFGTISSKQITAELQSKYGIEIDKRKFVNKTTVDAFGYTKLQIELYKGVIGEINVHVTESK